MSVVRNLLCQTAIEMGTCPDKEVLYAPSIAAGAVVKLSAIECDPLCSGAKREHVKIFGATMPDIFDVFVCPVVDVPVAIRPPEDSQAV